MYVLKKYSACLLFLIIAVPSFSQKVYTGIVIDSATFEELPGAIVHVKHSETRAVTDYHGGFSIRASRTDTLILSMLGFYPVELSLFFEEDVLLIRMSEQIRLLDEITIEATRLYPNEIVNRTKVAPKRVTALEGVFSPFDYFWKQEREKRKLARIIDENNRTQTYVQMITDPALEEIIMKAYDLTEEDYYERLAIFNQQYPSVSYSTEPEEIMDSLVAFFQVAKGKK